MRTMTCLMSRMSPYRRLFPDVAASASVDGVADTAAVAPKTAAALRIASLRDISDMAPEPPGWCVRVRARSYGPHLMADQHEVEHRKKPIRIIGAAKHQVHARRIAQSVASHFHLAP